MSVKEQEQSGEAEVEEKKGNSPYFEEFTISLEKVSSPEEKLKMTLTFMEESLGRKEGPRFGDFWEARKLCLPLFREGISGEARAELWTSYTYLTGEAKSLRERVDQEGQFAIEQIELALEAIEKDIAGRHLATERVQEVPLPEALKAKREALQKSVGELVIFDTLASRITALRQELIDTPIRMRHKNTIFQRLSKVGDEVFPPRKALMKELTELFLQEVEAFSKLKFPSGQPRGPLHFLREEIKAFQSLAKALRLTPKGFNKSRQILSKCWDAVREQSEERRKEWAEKREFFRENKAKVSEKIQEFAENYGKEETSIEEATKQVAEISKFMRETDLGGDEVRALKEELVKAQKPLQARIDEQGAAQRAEEEERRREREGAIQGVKEQVETLLEKVESLDAEDIIAEREVILAAIKEAPIPKFEKSSFEKSLRPLREVIRRKKEEALLELSDDDKQALANLQEVLSQRQERRNEIKSRLEEIRKQKGGSGLDFGKAMELNEQEAERKEQLDEAEAGVREIEERIEKLGDFHDFGI